MNLAEEAYRQLFPACSRYKEFQIRYSGKFSDYSGNIRYSPSRGMMSLGLSDKWVGVSDEIQIGVIQHLILKATKEKMMTLNIELYNLFLQKVHMIAPKNSQDPMLLDSFNRINQRFFKGEMLAPNLVWNGMALRKIGCYTYGDDTITISSALRGQPELIDYVMYHEMLHKKVKWNPRSRRGIHHSREFRRLEKLYPAADTLEINLKRHLASCKRKSWLGRLF
jgi:hypothetical protein